MKPLIFVTLIFVSLFSSSLLSQNFSNEIVLLDNLNVQLGGNNLVNVEDVVYCKTLNGEIHFISHFNDQLNLYKYTNGTTTDLGDIGDLDGFIVDIFDYNSDGLSDILGHFHIKQAESTTSFSDKFIPVNGNMEGRIYRAQDFNGDGITDILTRQVVFVNGSLTENLHIYELDSNNDIMNSYSFFNDEELIGADMYDLNQDGNMDVVYIVDYFGNAELIIQLNNGNGSFSEQAINVSNTESLMIAEDIDNDSDLDLIITGFNGKDLELLLNNNGVFAEDAKIIDTERIYSLSASDFDQDGNMDLAYLENDNFDSLIVTIAMGLGDGTFSPADIKGSVDFNGVSFTNSYEQAAEDWLNICDYDNDGDADLLVNAITEQKFLAFENLLGVTDFDNDGFTVDVDCDDNNPNVNPGQTEQPYNGLDDDCDATTLDDDLDQDGFPLADDCDDNNADVNPNQTEQPYNGLDDDCDATTLDDDLDQDGFLLADDCDDNDADVNPNAEEIPNNGIDEDCNGEDLVLSTHELSNTKIKIYPNPVSKIININVNGKIEFVASLFDLNGKLIYTARNKNLIRINQLDQGTYLLEIRDLISGQKVVEKIIIRR